VSIGAKRSACVEKRFRRIRNDFVRNADGASDRLLFTETHAASLACGVSERALNYTAWLNFRPQRCNLVNSLLMNTGSWRVCITSTIAPALLRCQS
jgi:hypothetical protein